MTSPSTPAPSSASTLRSNTSKKSKKNKPPKASTSALEKTPPATPKPAASLGDPADLFRDELVDDGMPMSVAEWKEREALKKARPATQQAPMSPEGPADAPLPPAPSPTPSDSDDELPLAVTYKRKRRESVSTCVNPAKENLLKIFLGCRFRF